jgi:glucose/arabinose dehydrogenase
VNRALLATAVATAVLLGGCASGDDRETSSFGVDRPTTTSASSTDSTTTSSNTTTPPAAPASRPLTAPTVTLSEIGAFENPVHVATRPGDDARYVVERAGRVVAVSDTTTDVVLDITDLTVAQGERGFLGLAFHPTDDLAYTHFTDTNGDNVVAEFVVDPIDGRFDRASLREVLTVDQPFSTHNGGQLAFGPDDLLYISIGDGGSGGDPERYALDLTSRLGKILRIDPTPESGQPFSVPTGNPFADDPNADPTIWAYGLRNAWRFSFDADTGDLWIGDVGQNEFEEINHSTADAGRDAGRGVNYGWSAFEGFERFNDDQVADDAVAPRFVYDHGGGRCSVIGGTVARGDDAGDLAGWYLFGDYCSGQIWALDPTAPPTAPRVIEVARLDALVSISVGPDGALHAVSDLGTIARLTADT